MKIPHGVVPMPESIPANAQAAYGVISQLEHSMNNGTKIGDTFKHSASKWQTSVGLIALSISVIFATWRSTSTAVRMSVIERDEFQFTAADVAESLRRQVKTSSSSMYALAAMVEADGGKWLETNFDKIASTILENYRGISNFDIAPFAVVKTKVPLQGNEGAIGHAMLSDPKRIESTLKTIRERKALMDGPLKLHQGGTAVIARFPVFTRFAPRYIPDIRDWWPNWSHPCCNTSLPLLGHRAEMLPGGLDKEGHETYFYGLIEFVSKLDKLTEDLRLDRVSEVMSYQFRNVNPHPSMADSPVFLHSEDAAPGTVFDNPVVIPISVPEVQIEWELLAVPKDGWAGTNTLYIVAMISIYGGLLISLVSFCFMEAKSFKIEATMNVMESLKVSIGGGDNDFAVIAQK